MSEYISKTMSVCPVCLKYIEIKRPMGESISYKLMNNRGEALYRK